jgi:hypothetical protein
LGGLLPVAASDKERRDTTEGGDMKASTKDKQFESIKRGMPVPAELQAHWK